MITDLWIENFKGIGKRQHIPLRPITLLFGANSSGKSSILHAMLYLRNILLTGECDPSFNHLESLGVSLGDFDSILHKRSGISAESISLSIRFEPNSREKRKFNEMAEANCEVVNWESRPDRQFADSSHLFECERSASPLPLCPSSIEIKIVIRKVNSSPVADADVFSPIETPIVSGFELSIDDIPFMRTCLEDDSAAFDSLSKETILSLVHPVWNDAHSVSRGNPTCEEWKLHFKLLRELRALALQNCALPEEPQSKITFILYTGLLELPEFQSGITDPTNTIPEGVFTIPLREYLDQVRPSQEFLDVNAVEPDCDALVLLCHEELAVNDDSDSSLSLSNLLGVLIPQGASCSKVIECIREYLFAGMVNGVPTNLRGRWTATSSLYRVSAIPQFDARITPYNRRYFLQHRKANELAETTAESAILGSLKWIRDAIGGLTHLGPKRSTVPRTLTSHTAVHFHDWTDGRAAWSWLLRCAESNVQSVSDLLHDNKWLNSGYSLKRICKAEVEIDDSISHSLNGNWMSPNVWQNLERMPGWSDLAEVQRACLTMRAMYEAASAPLAQMRRTRSNYQRLAVVHNKTMSSTDDVRSGTELHPQEVGEGLTQVIPVLAAVVRASTFQKSEPCGSLVLVEQPELHLHPSMAARMADVLINGMYKRKVTPSPLEFMESDDDSSREGLTLEQLNALPRFRNEFHAMIETHSEHLILRILRRIRQTTDGELPEHIPPVKPDDVCVLWVDNLGDGTTIQRLRIDERGEFIDRWPNGFFSERAEELY